MNLRIKHKQVVIKLNYYLAVNGKLGEKKDVVSIGKSMMDIGLDQITDGFWVWDIKNNIEFYSDKFRETLGFTSEKDFPNTPASWQKQIFKSDAEAAIKAFNAHRESEENPYYLEVSYYKKNRKESVRLICAGTIVDRDSDNEIMVGTHEITHH